MSIRRRWALPALALILAAALGCSSEPTGPDETAAEAARNAAPTSLLLITVDTLRADRVGAYGYPAASTPNLDRLAAEGVRMDHALSHVPLTLPSHASMMTGHLPVTLGVRNNGTYVLGEEHSTLAEILEERGYVTGAAVSAFVLLEKFGLAQGFEVYDDLLGEDGMVRALDAEIPADRVVSKWRRWSGEHLSTPGKPFFYWAHFYDPHLPYEPPEPERSLFEDSPYDGEVAFVDRQIGEMLADLESRGLAESTLVVVTSDHGEMFGEHGEVGHGLTAYRPALRVPLILRGPGVPSGLGVEPRVGLVDLMPTLLELLGAPAAGGGDGRSFLDLLRGGTEDSPRVVYFETLLGAEDRNWAPLVGLYSGDRKLISLPRPELYDAGLDATEERNLVTAERRTYRRLDEELQQLLLQAAGAAPDAKRELTEEDVQKLESLGYISGGDRGEAGLDPKDGLELDRRLREVEKLLEKGELDRAEEALAAARDGYPGRALPSFFLFEHRIAAARGSTDGAVAALARGVAALPQVYPLRYEHVRYLVDQELFDRAAEAASELVRRYPELSQGWILLGRSLEETRPEEALDAYGKARRLEPDNVALADRTVDLLARRGALVEAAALLDDLVRRGAYDDRPDGLFKAAMLHLGNGNLPRAEELFARGLDLEGNGFFSLTYAMVLDRNGKRPAATEALRRALESGELSPEQTEMARSTLAAWESAP